MPVEPLVALAAGEAIASIGAPKRTAMAPRVTAAVRHLVRMDLELLRLSFVVLHRQ